MRHYVLDQYEDDEKAHYHLSRPKISSLSPLYETQLGAWPGLDPPLSIQILRLTMSFVAATQ